MIMFNVLRKNYWSGVENARLKDPHGWELRYRQIIPYSFGVILVLIIYLFVTTSIILVMGIQSSYFSSDIAFEAIAPIMVLSLGILVVLEAIVEKEELKENNIRIFPDKKISCHYKFLIRKNAKQIVLFTFVVILFITARIIEGFPGPILLTVVMFMFIAMTLGSHFNRLVKSKRMYLEIIFNQMEKDGVIEGILKKIAHPEPLVCDEAGRSIQRVIGEGQAERIIELDGIPMLTNSLEKRDIFLYNDPLYLLATAGYGKDILQFRTVRDRCCTSPSVRGYG